MGFKQTFVNVKTVKNLDDVDLNEEKNPVVRDLNNITKI